MTISSDCRVGESKWHQQLERAVHADAALETWRHHYRLRSGELDIVRQWLPPNGAGVLLEVGCGNGLGTAYLADSAAFSIATDLPGVDHSAHAIGLDRAAHLFQAVGLDAPLLGCSGECMPFADESFDTVLMVFSLEHIPDKDACLAEVRRVLKPGGRLLATVPAAAWSFVTPVGWYLEMGRRVVRRLRPTTPASDERDARTGQTAPGSVVKDWGSFRAAYPRFPLPNPHGAYRSVVAEFREQRPSAWVARGERAGLSVTAVTPLNVLPAPLLVTGRRLRWVTALFRRVDEWLRSQSSAVPFAQMVCLVFDAPHARR